MSDDLLITPGSRKLEIKDSSGNVDAKIETDASGNLAITNAGGDISIGDTSSDIFVGDGTNNVDIVFEQDGEIRGTSGVTVTLGASGSNVRMASDLNLNGNDITSVGDLTITGNLTITGDLNTVSATDLDVADKTITLGRGQTEASSGGSGIVIDGSLAELKWDEGDDRWEFNKGVFAPSFVGNGSGLTNVNAATVDGIDSASFLRSDTADTGTGNITLTGTSELALTIGNGSARRAIKIDSNQWPEVRFFNAGTENARIGTAQNHSTYNTSAGDFYIYCPSRNSMHLIVPKDGGPFTRDNGAHEIWDSGNDGSGSGLNADLLDDEQGSYYLDRANHTGTLTLGTVGTFNIEGGSADWNTTTPGTTQGSLHFDPGTTSNNFGNAITFGASDTSNGETAQAGIYIRSDGNYGTKMYIATTDSYASGSKTSLLLNSNGDVSVHRGALQIQGVDVINESKEFIATKITVDSRLVIDGSKIYDNPANGNNKGIRFGGGGLVPINGSGTDLTDIVDIGTNTVRFKDLYLSGLINATGAITSGGLITADRFLSGLGTAASPAIQVGDTNTGFFDSGANEIGVSCNGALEYEFKPAELDLKSNNLAGVGTATIHDINFDGVIRSTNNANVDGPNFDVSTTNKSNSEYAYRVTRNSSTVAGIKTAGDALLGAISSGAITSNVSDGTAITLQRSGSTAAKFGVAGGPVGFLVLNDTTSDNVAAIKGTSAAILPSTNSGGNKHGTMDLGSSSVKFRNLHLSNYASAASYRVGSTTVIDGNREGKFSGGLVTSSTRANTGYCHPVGHYSTGEEVFSIDPTWTSDQLAEFFDATTTEVNWFADSTAPDGYAIRIQGQVSVGPNYGSGFPYISVGDVGDEFYMECYIRNEDSNQTHYMGGIEKDESFGAPDSGSGNPGSFGYWVMLNTNPGTSWTKVSGYIKNTGGSNTTGEFETGANYFVPMALFNYTAGAGTRTCYISGWKCFKVTRPGGMHLKTTADSRPAIIAENTGGINGIIQEWIGDSDKMQMFNASGGDYFLRNSQQNNGIFFADATGGVSLRYNNVDVLKVDSAGGVKVNSGSLKMGTTTVIDSSRNITNVGTITTSSTITVDPPSGDAVLALAGAAGAQTLRLDQNSIRTTTSSDLSIFTSGNTRQIFLDQSTGNTGFNMSSDVPHAGTAVHIKADDTTPSLNTTAIDDTTLVLSNSDDDYGTVFGTFGTGMGVIQQRRTATAVYYDLLLNPYGGNIGIGTTSSMSGVKLNVRSGNIHVGAFGSTGSKFGVRYSSDDGSSHWYTYSATGGELVFGRSGTIGDQEKVRFDASGSVGIGTNNPSQKLQVDGGNIFINQPDTGGAPAMTSTLFMYGYEGRGVGIKIRDSANSASGASNREWFIGSGYNQSGFNIGFASDGSQSSYTAQNKLSITTGGAVTIAGGLTCAAISSSGNIATSAGNLTSAANSASAGVTIKRTNSSTTGAKGFIAWKDSDNNVVASIDSRGTGSNNSGDLRFHTSTGASESEVYGNSSPTLILGTNNLATFNGNIVNDIGNSGNDSYIELKNTGYTGNVTSLRQNADSTRAELNSTERSIYIQAGSGGGAGAAEVRLYANQVLALRADAGGDVHIPDRLRHQGDSNTYIQFHAADQFRVVTGGAERLEVRSNQVSIGTSSNRIPLSFANVPAMSSNGSTLTVGDVDENDDIGVVDILAMAGTGRLYLEDGSLMVHGTSTSSAKFRLLSTGQLDCDGDVIAFSANISSDRKLKENIRPLENSLDKVLTLHGVKFDWKSKERDNNQLGFIAQDVEKVLPELVSEVDTLGAEDETHKVVNYDGVVPVLVEAMKEQQKLINRLEERIKELENKKGE